MTRSAARMPEMAQKLTHWPGMSGAAGKVEPLDEGAAVGQTPGSHQTGGHHRVHALAVEVARGPPIGRRRASRARGPRRRVPPPGLGQDALEVFALAARAQSLRLVVSHRRDQPRRHPAVVLEPFDDGSRRDQQTAQLAAAGQAKAQVRRATAAAHRQVGTDAGRLERQLLEARRRGVGNALREPARGRCRRRCDWKRRHRLREPRHRPS